MKTKKDRNYSREHTKKRLKERYNLTITDGEYEELCDSISKKLNTRFISEEKQKKDIQQIYDITFKNSIIRAVWSKANMCIKTVLPNKRLTYIYTGEL